ncbi:MAG TPA: Ig-like domain-containing protein [Kofleriaceae bacterium]|nr:Ig-like domain-containing protein [Kofleriaceae bacterium]
MVKTLLASGIAMGLCGCALDQPVEYSSTAGMSFEEFRAMVPRETGTGYYVVDWDRVLKNDQELFEFWGSLEQGALAIYNTGTDIKWDDTQKKNITYCIGASFGTNKQLVVDAMKAATDGGWEKMADVNFIYVPTEDANCTGANGNVVFDVNQATGQPFLARAFFPNDQRANRNVIIDTTSFDPTQTGGIPLANILGHELGHTLGFRHEHTRPEANATQCFEDNQFRGVTVYDSASVMHYPQCNGTSTTLAFTELDRQGVSSVYGPPLANPAPMAQVTAPSDGATVPPDFAVEASVVDTDLVKAELFIDGSSYQTLSASPFTFQVTGLTLGAHGLKIVGTDANGQVGETTINVTVAKAGGGGSGDGEGDDGNDIEGGCSAGGSSSFACALGMLGFVLVRRRRR